MISGYASITVKPERAEQFVENFHKLRLDVAERDHGTIRYDLHRHRENPNRFVVIEEYADQVALDLHMQVQQTRDWVIQMFHEWFDDAQVYFCDPVNYERKRVE